MRKVPPLNDGGCLSKLHDAADEFARTPQAIAMAAQFEGEKDIVDFIRSLEQRDDLGDPLDGPRIQCDVSQRLRLPTYDPACFERTGLFFAFMRLVCPDVIVSSATVEVNDGLHTFPVVLGPDGPRVVILDPRTRPLRNAMTAATYKLQHVSPMASGRIAPWFASMTRATCRDQGIDDVYRCAVSDIRNGLLTGRPLQHTADIEDMLAVAELEARLFGPAGRVAYRRVRDSVRNLSIKLDRKEVTSFLRGLLERAQPIASEAIKAALIAKFGPAAAIALNDVDLQVKKPAPADIVPPADEPDTRERRMEQIRRMTLAFRNPQRKET